MQVAIGGRNKYTINGHTAKANRVQNLFHSVQLNVNNPHFLIMQVQPWARGVLPAACPAPYPTWCASQGRITKVINMKPEELRNMIEETAGTRMYEQKKLAALKTMEKKQAKVDEINKILAEEIMPLLEKLQAERAEMIRFMSNSAECERLTRFMVAYEFKEAEGEGARAAAEATATDDELHATTAAAVRAGTDITAAEARLKEVAQRQQSHLDSGYKALLEAKEDAGKEVVQRTSAVQNKRKVLEEERRALQALRQQGACCAAQGGAVTCDN